MARRTFALLVGAALLSACGTTVPAVDQRDAQGLVVPGQVTDETGSTTRSDWPAASAPGTGASAYSGAPGPAVGGDGLAGPAGGGRSVSAAAPFARRGGVTSTTVAIGFVYSPNSAAAAAAVSGGSADFGDPVAYARAVVKRLNATGGIGGRRVVLEPYAVDSFDTRPRAQQQQAMCDYFTQDHKVFAVINGGGDIVRACFAKHDVVPVAASFATLGEKELAADPGYVDVSALTPEAALANLVDSFSRNDYLRTKWETASGTPGGVAPIKIGILHPDLPPWQRAVREHLMPGLAKRGFAVDSNNVVEWHFAEDSAQVTDSIAAFQSAVLRFRSNGVTHVFLVENNGMLFAQFAERQNYRPRYAVSSANQVQGWYASGAVPGQQLTGATGIGWYPTYDLASPEKYAPPGRAECLKIMREGNAEVPNDNNAILGALSTCDEFLLLQRAIATQRDGPVFSRAAVRAGLESLGKGFVFAGIPGGSYAPGKRYPIDQAWLWAWDPGCSCMRYTSGAFPLRGP